jgi:23S rRNA pseudouridine2605 synthase
VNGTDPSRKVGLARALSKMGYCSRSHAFDLIRAGRVGLNGGICRNPEAPVRSGRDGIEIDGRALAAQKKVYLMFNKPRGIVTTASDEKGRETVYAYLDDGLPWVAPVGRLDKASEGLLLLTNDSEWAGRVLAPGTRLDKTYHVQIGAVAEAHLLESLTKGIKIDDGSFRRVKSAKVLRGGEKNTWLEIVLDEGKNRHIRRMLASLRINVLRLLRVSIGPLVLGELPKGASRPLRDMEKEELDRVMGQQSGGRDASSPAGKRAGQPEEKSVRGRRENTRDEFLRAK